MKEIKICENHPEFEVPLIWTFAFNGAEYWCPYCGQNSGMLGAGEDVEETPELKERLKNIKNILKSFCMRMLSLFVLKLNIRANG